MSHALQRIRAAAAALLFALADFFRFTDIGENVLVQPDAKMVVGGLATNLAGGYGVARINNP